MVNLFRLNSERQVRPPCGGINLRRQRSAWSNDISSANLQSSDRTFLPPETGSPRDHVQTERGREIFTGERSTKEKLASSTEFRLDFGQESSSTKDSNKRTVKHLSHRTLFSNSPYTATTMPHQGTSIRHVGVGGAEGAVSVTHDITSSPGSSDMSQNASSASPTDHCEDFWNRDDAVKALGFAAVKLKKKMQEKVDENNELKKTISHLEAIVEDIVAREAAHSTGLFEDNELYSLRQQLCEAQGRLEWLQNEAADKFQQLETFEFELMSKNKKIEELQEKLADRTLKMVELEVDLKFHDSTLASCATARRRLEESLLNWEGSLSEISEMKAPRRFSLSKGQHTNAPHIEIEERHQKHVDHLKLLLKNMKAELSEVKNKFKAERADQEFKIGELEDQLSHSKRKVISLSRRVKELERGYRAGETYGDMPLDEGDVVGKSRVGFLEDRVKELEKQRARDKEAMAALKIQLRATKDKAEEKVQRCRSTIERLSLENETKAIRIAQLEVDSMYKGECDEHLNNEYEMIQKLIKDKFDQLDRLRMENDTKNKKIAALRSELVHYLSLAKAGNAKRGSLNTETTMSVTTHSTDPSSCSSAKHDIVKEAERRLVDHDDRLSAIVSRDSDDEDGLLDTLDQNEMVRIHL